MVHVNQEVIVWRPETDADRRAVMLELNAILSSHHFRNSKRYPALLRYVVEKSIDGHIDQLKERTLGIEVFGRRPDYDTNADPVVRFTAGEIRKKIAQYYQEKNGRPEIQICLPLGSYAPQFTISVSGTESSAERRGDLDQEETSSQVPRSPVANDAEDREPIAVQYLPQATASRRSRRYLLVFVSLVLGLLGTGGFWIYRSLQPGPTDRLWSSLVSPSGPVLIVVSGRSLELTEPEPSRTSFFDHMIGQYHHVSVSTAIAMSRMTAVLQGYHKRYTIKEASVTGLPDLRERSVILVGALNNEWTLRLIQPLRYRFVPGPLARIEDSQNLANRDWTVDFSQPFPSVTHDFAIVARYHDATTNGTVMIVAGLGAYGTEAAGEFVSTPQYLEQVSRQIPNGLNNRNVEMVIQTDIIAGESGPPRLVAATTF